jgi:hypothetical protein
MCNGVFQQACGREYTGKSLCYGLECYIGEYGVFFQKWEQQKKSENLLEVYRAKDYQELTKDKMLIDKMDTDFMLRVLNHIKVFEDGRLMLMFLDGTEIECKNEEE